MDIAVFMTSSVARLAAKGVLLREPLNPAEPELAQQTVLPCWSVIVMIVLLNDEKICTCADDNVLFTLLVEPRRVDLTFLAIFPLYF
jgi:hypothetical protein